MKHTEHQYQAAVFQWSARAEAKYPVLRFMFAIENAFGRRITPMQAGRYKAEGHRSGVPDFFLPVVIRWESAGLWVEMKSKTGTMKQSQKDYQDFLIAQGYKHVVARDPEVAIDAIERYVKDYYQRKSHLIPGIAQVMQNIWCDRQKDL